MHANLGQLTTMPLDLSSLSEPRLRGPLPPPRVRSKKLWRISEESEEARYPVLRVAPDGTLLHANKAGRELVERVGYGIGQRLPGQLCGLFPEVLRSGQGEDIELRSEGESFVFSVMPRPLMQDERRSPADRAPGGAGPGDHDPRALLDSLPIFFYLTGLNGNPGNDWVSPGTKAVTGFTPDECLSSPGFWESRLHPEDFWRVIRAFRTAGARGGVSVEYRWRRSDGRYGWFLDQAVLVNGHGGTERLLAGARIDITARREAEQWRQQGTDFLEALVGAVSDGVCLIDDSSRYIFMSAPLERLLGTRREEWVRGNLEAAVHPDDQARLASAVLRAIGGRKNGCRARFRTASGAHIELALSFSPFSWKGRQLALASVTCLNQQG
jgi:PAS domain S-box-containing protein